jgi:hypothetical protein
MQLAGPQPLEEVRYRRGNDSRGDQIDRRRGRPADDPSAAGQRTPRNSIAHRPGRRSVKSSQRDHLEILVTEKISVPPAENKKIYLRRQRRNRQWQELKDNRHTYQRSRRRR